LSRVIAMPEVTLSIVKLVEAMKSGRLEKLREELKSSDKVYVKVFRLPRFKLKVRNPNKELVELNSGIINRLEYALLKSFIEASKSNRLPVFKEVAELASDYKATAKYLVTLAEMGYVIFADPVKARLLVEATKAISESRYARRIKKVLDLPFTLNIESLEKTAVTHQCRVKGEKVVCFITTHDEEREQDKVQIALINEVLSTKQPSS